MTERFLQQLPTEIVESLVQKSDYYKCSIYRQYSPIKRLIGTKVYWRQRILRIHTKDQLHTILRDECTKNAEVLDLTSAEIDDIDISFISGHFIKIRKINLSRNPNVTDTGVEELLKVHGRDVRTLNLGKLFRLTNLTMEHLAQYCYSLKKLSLEGGMFTSAAIRLMLTVSLFKLDELSLSRCHIMDTRELSMFMVGFERLKRLDLSYLDGLEPYQVQPILRECPRLRNLKITGCLEFTLKSIRELELISPDLHIEHDARLEDHSINGIRRFLLGLVAFG